MRTLFAFTKKEFLEQFRSKKIMILAILFIFFGLMDFATIGAEINYFSRVVKVWVEGVKSILAQVIICIDEDEPFPLGVVNTNVSCTSSAFLGRWIQQSVALFYTDVWFRYRRRTIVDNQYLYLIRRWYAMQ